ncbi:MFS transporter [Streptomyces guryensis]|uniref:MFS transporter n=1 Tax=Streptomyces guryensis TaxID=2886947 RepID=A0A9Q3ZCC1_9ACTN|nr:MFS transporter [Streptomyces guryensis]MCD9879477.1 MFS transporter [Streptomyces guryensis]
MRGGQALGRQFGWLWGAYAVSAVGTWLAFDAFSLIAVIVLHAGATEVAVLSAAGLAVGAAVATPLGPWMEFRRKRPVMMCMDLVRCGMLLTIPVAFALGSLTFVQLLVVSIVVGAADISFTAASGAFVKSLLPPEDLLAANARFEATQWTATILGPPLGGVAMGVFGPVMTVVANAVSFLLSAAGIRAIGGTETHPVRSGPAPAGGLLEGWRYILAHPTLRPMFFNTVLYNALIMVSLPLLAVLMVGDLGFAAWQYGLAFSVPSIGGLIGSRLARRLVPRFGERRVLLVSGMLRACWPIGLAFVGPGTAGLVLVMAVELGVIVSCAVFNPVYSTIRLRQTDSGRVARTLSAWSVTGKATAAGMTALWGLLAGLTGPRAAIAVAGVLVLATPLLLPRRIAGSPEMALPSVDEAA